MIKDLTHLELLDYLREHEEYWTSLRANPWAKLPAFNALKSVVELHHPAENNQKYCEHCSEFNEENPFLTVEYPCPTIQAVTKELK